MPRSVEWSLFESGASSCIDAFNKLFMLPDVDVKLDGERMLNIRKWTPLGSDECGSHLKVKVEGVLYIYYGASFDRFDAGREEFNSVAHCPLQPLDLGDGRILKLKEWTPTYEAGHSTTVSILGLVEEKPNG